MNSFQKHVDRVVAAKVTSETGIIARDLSIE